MQEDPQVTVYTDAYDADGIRKSKSADGVFTEYLTDKNRPFA